MDGPARDQLFRLVHPLYQDLDGHSRMEEVERISHIARKLFANPSPEEARELELLLLFQNLGGWLEKLGNRSRIVLALEGAVSDEELRRTVGSVRRLEQPVSRIEQTVAAAREIDASGVRGLAERLIRGRREGNTPREVMEEIVREEPVLPDWLPERALSWVHARHEQRRTVARHYLAEEQLEDLGAEQE